MDTAIFRITLSIINGELAVYDIFKIIPCRISSADGYNNYQPTPATGEKRERILNRLTQYTNDLGDLELKFS